MLPIPVYTPICGPHTGTANKKQLYHLSVNCCYPGLLFSIIPMYSYNNVTIFFINYKTSNNFCHIHVEHTLCANLYIFGTVHILFNTQSPCSKSFCTLPKKILLLPVASWGCQMSQLNVSKRWLLPSGGKSEENIFFIQISG